MKKRTISNVIRLLALLLTTTLLLSGCFGVILPPMPRPEGETVSVVSDTSTEFPSDFPTDLPTEEPTPTETEPFDPGEEAMIRWQNGGEKDYLPDEPVELVPFSEMEYVRPDVDALYADFDDLTEQAKDSADAEALLEAYYGLYTRYVSFYSMDSLANIKYSQNTTERYYKDEYDFCENETPNLEEKLEALYKGFAASPARDKLEEAYFGGGFFEKYDDYEVYTNPEYLRLSQEEAALLSEYRELTSDIQVSYDNETKSLDEWLESDDYYEYIGALQAYYEQYNPAVGEIFVKLVKVRQQLAAALDYDNYAEYSYEITYHRDYSPEDGDVFLNGIRQHLVPVLEDVNMDYSLLTLNSGSSTESSVMEMVRSASKNIGGAVWDAFRFMQAYELCDIAKSPVKIESSFQTYLYDYEVPFVLVNAKGSGDDYMTFAHEFGHFTDSFHNYGADEDLETAETFSQAMEFLALKYTDTLKEQQKARLIKYQLVELLETFVYQGAYADFESRVYALDPEELSVEKINQLFLDCCTEYGVAEPGFDFYYSQCWIDVIHFFEVPYYIISYCVSAETALQVYQLEEETEGEGVAAYFRLLDREYGAGVQQIMEDAGLDNPFREEVLSETGDFFREKLGLD